MKLLIPAVMVLLVITSVVCAAAPSAIHESGTGITNPELKEAQGTGETQQAGINETGKGTTQGPQAGLNETEQGIGQDQQEQIQQETQNIGENETIRIQQREE